MFCVACLAPLAARSSSSTSPVDSVNVSACRLSATCSGVFMPTMTSTAWRQQVGAGHGSEHGQPKGCGQRRYRAGPMCGGFEGLTAGGRCGREGHKQRGRQARVRASSSPPLLIAQLMATALQLTPRAAAMALSSARRGAHEGSSALKMRPRGPSGSRSAEYLPERTPKPRGE
eukprot:4844712-Prymnesium_polylepis.1